MQPLMSCEDIDKDIRKFILDIHVKEGYNPHFEGVREEPRASCDLSDLFDSEF